MSSGTTGVVANDEPLARYVLTGSWLYKDGRAGTPLRPNAWIPHPHIELSVYRINGWNDSEITALGNIVASERETNHRAKEIEKGASYPEEKITFRYHGRGEILASEVRLVGLDVIPDEPPHRHAEIVNWPPLVGNKKHDEAAHLLYAARLNERAKYVAV